MKNQFVNTLQEGDVVSDYFRAVRKDLRTQQNGTRFLQLVFKDCSGDVPGIMWNNADKADQQFELGDVVNVGGRVQTYQGNLQIVVERIHPVRSGEFDPDDLERMPEGAKEAPERLRAILETIEEPNLRRLVLSFLSDPDFMQRFNVAAAAKRWHHAHRGGLALHCWEMARLAQTACEVFPRANRDLVLTGVFLHDIGKLYEMSHEQAVDYTTEGRLLGHIHLGIELIHQKLREIPGFPDNLRLHLQHLILSHHGALDCGSPIVPKTIEAVLLHHIDNLDAQAAAVERIAEEARLSRRVWSDYQPLISREIYAADV